MQGIINFMYIENPELITCQSNFISVAQANMPIKKGQVGWLGNLSVMALSEMELDRHLNCQVVDNFAWLNSERHQLEDKINDLEAELLDLKQQRDWYEFDAVNVDGEENPHGSSI